MLKTFWEIKNFMYAANHFHSPAPAYVPIFYKPYTSIHIYTQTAAAAATAAAVTAVVQKGERASLLCPSSRKYSYTYIHIHPPLQKDHHTRTVTFPHFHKHANIQHSRCGDSSILKIISYLPSPWGLVHCHSDHISFAVIFAPFCQAE